MEHPNIWRNSGFIPVSIINPDQFKSNPCISPATFYFTTPSNLSTNGIRKPANPIINHRHTRSNPTSCPKSSISCHHPNLPTTNSTGRSVPGNNNLSLGTPTSHGIPHRSKPHNTIRALTPRHPSLQLPNRSKIPSQTIRQFGPFQTPTTPHTCHLPRHNNPSPFHFPTIIRI